MPFAESFADKTTLIIKPLNYKSIKEESIIFSYHRIPNCLISSLSKPGLGQYRIFREHMSIMGTVSCCGPHRNRNTLPQLE